jgi:phosphoribosyl 1,2-cyclic phosphate phosphodiesterase
MLLTVLGSGTSCGVPQIGCTCATCTSKDPRDNRTRCSSLIESDTTRILIDCGPDFREQMLRLKRFEKIDAVLLTHIHYDHVGGIDDLRPFCQFGDIDIFADKKTADGLTHTIPYCFAEHKYPGVPEIHMKIIEPHLSFFVGDFKVTPIRVMHGKLPIIGYRINNIAYITDMKTIDDDELVYIEGVDTLIVNALRHNDYPAHPTHQSVEDAISFARKVKAKRTYLVHMSHHIGLHKDVDQHLPENIRLAYDGMKLLI